MFDEFFLENAISHIWIEIGQFRLLSEWGIPLTIGQNVVTYTDAVRIVELMARVLPNVPKRSKKRFAATRRQVQLAFGPEFEQRHP